MGAMTEEIAPLLEIFDVNFVHEIGGVKVHECTYKRAGDLKIFISHSKIGKVNAAICTSVLISHFKIDELIFCGVAGGLKDLAIGDLVVVSKTCQHDVDISAFGHKLGFIPESKGVFCQTSAKLNEIAKEAARALDLEPKSEIAASGDQFISNSDKKAFIVKEFGAKVCDMESASIALVCSEFGIECCILRSISDDGDNDANFKFDEFLELASKRCASVVCKMIELKYA